MVMVAGLLFLAFAYFAVAQASAGRNDAQGAADAAALAAAQDARDDIYGDLLDVFDPETWEDLLDGDGLETFTPCAEASELAEKNEARTTTCDRVWDPDSGYAVTVRNEDPVGSSVVPGTENRYAEADATAVIEPRCGIEKADDEGKKFELECDGWNEGLPIDPERLDDLLPDPEDLFSVHLVDQ